MRHESAVCIVLERLVMYHRSSNILGIGVAFLFFALLLGLSRTGMFLPQRSNAPFVASHPQPAKQSNTSGSPTTVITGGKGGANKIPDPVGECFSGITSNPADLLKLLAPGWTLQNLGEKYRNETRPILCYDNWKPQWSVPGGTWLKTSDFLTTMSWPSDLFQPSVSQILVVQRPDDVLKPSHNQTTKPNTGQQQGDKCKWTVDLLVAQPTINICDLISTVLNAAILTPLKFGVDTLAGDTNSFLWTTPPQDTYANPDLALFWNTSLYIVNALLAVALAWAGIRYMIGKSFGSWLSYADLLEMLPRLILALIAAYLSARICQVVIDGSNALSSVWNFDLLSSLKNDPKDLFTTFVQILLALLTLILLLEEAVRFALLFVLIGFSPIWAFCGALRETQFIFKGGLKALFFVTLLQPCQIAVMSLGQHLTANLGGNADSLLYSFISLALMLLVIFMMGWFLRAAGMSMPFGLVGVAGLAIGTRMVAGGIRSGATTVKNAPRIASTVIHAPRNIRAGISRAQVSMSKAHQTINTVGKWIAHPPGTRGSKTPSRSGGYSFLDATNDYYTSRGRKP